MAPPVSTKGERSTPEEKRARPDSASCESMFSPEEEEEEEEEGEEEGRENEKADA